MTELKTLYITTTNQCQLKCPFCYTKFIPQFNSNTEKDHIDPDMVLKVIKKNKYNIVVFHGGEPLLYPEVISDIVNRVDDKNVKFAIQSNLAFQALSQKQIEALLLMSGGYGTSYNVDRFAGIPDIRKQWENNIKELSTYGLECSVIVTITEDQINKQNPWSLKKFFDNIGVNYIIFERPIFKQEDILNDKQKYINLYHAVDNYMGECVKIFPKWQTNLFDLFQNSIDNKTPFYDNHCSEWTHTLYYKTLKYGCPSLESRNISNRDMIEECLQCDFYPYCKGDCECFNHVCAFPKNTFKTVYTMLSKEEDYANEHRKTN